MIVFSRSLRKSAAELEACHSCGVLLVVWARVVVRRCEHFPMVTSSLFERWVYAARRQGNIWSHAVERWSYSARRQHSELATCAQAAAESMMLRLVGASRPAAGSDPFGGILPWELTTCDGLRLPQCDDGSLDVEFGTELFEFTGVCLIEAAVPPAIVAECREAGDALTLSVREAVRARGIDPDGLRGFRFHEACQRGPGRYNMRLLPAPPPFDDAALNDDAAWMPLVRRILGDDCTLLFQGLVVSEPGATAQQVHSDGPPLDLARWLQHEPPPPWLPAAPADGCSAHHGALPCHALTVFVPLIDLTAANGATSYLPGTHQCSLATAALEAEATEAGSSSGAGTPARLEVRRLRACARTAPSALAAPRRPRASSSLPLRVVLSVWRACRWPPAPPSSLTTEPSTRAVPTAARNAAPSSTASTAGRGLKTTSTSRASRKLRSEGRRAAAAAAARGALGWPRRSISRRSRRSQGGEAAAESKHL